MKADWKLFLLIAGAIVAGLVIYQTQFNSEDDQVAAQRDALEKLIHDQLEDTINTASSKAGLTGFKAQRVSESTCIHKTGGTFDCSATVDFTLANGDIDTRQISMDGTCDDQRCQFEVRQ